MAWQIGNSTSHGISTGADVTYVIAKSRQASPKPIVKKQLVGLTELIRAIRNIKRAQKVIVKIKIPDYPVSTSSYIWYHDKSLTDTDKANCNQYQVNGVYYK